MHQIANRSSKIVNDKMAVKMEKMSSNLKLCIAVSKSDKSGSGVRRIQYMSEAMLLLVTLCEDLSALFRD